MLQSVMDRLPEKVDPVYPVMQKQYKKKYEEYFEQIGRMIDPNKKAVVNWLVTMSGYDASC